MNENDIIKQCQLNDLQAFNDLFHIYGNKAYRTAFLIVGKKDLSEDIVQEAFIQCYKKIRSLSNPVAFQAWFYRIVVRLSWKLSSAERKHSYALSLDSESATEASVNENFTEYMERNETYTALKASLDKLDKNLRTTIVLYYFNELSVREIAKIMNCFEGTVKSRLFNARKRLQKEMIYHSHYENKLFEKECHINA